MDKFETLLLALDEVYRGSVLPWVSHLLGLDEDDDLSLITGIPQSRLLQHLEFYCASHMRREYAQVQRCNRDINAFIVDVWTPVVADRRHPNEDRAVWYARRRELLQLLMVMLSFKQFFGVKELTLDQARFTADAVRYGLTEWDQIQAEMRVKQIQYCETAAPLLNVHFPQRR